MKNRFSVPVLLGLLVLTASCSNVETTRTEESAQSALQAGWTSQALAPRGTPGETFNLAKRPLIVLPASASTVAPLDLAATRLPVIEGSKLSAKLNAFVAESIGLDRPDISVVAHRRGLWERDGRILVEAVLSESVTVGDGQDHLLLDGHRLPLDRVREDRFQLWASRQDLEDLATSPSVKRIRESVKLDTYVTSEGVAITGADDLQGLGMNGAGVTVGIIDSGFEGYNSLLGTELPDTVLTESFYPGNDITGGGGIHGTGVAEIVHDMAPEAALYLVNIGTQLDFESAIDFLVAQDVDIITTSLGSVLWEPVDGRGSLAQTASDATDAGVPLFAAAGNFGNRHYSAPFTPSSSPEYHQFLESSGNVLALGEGGICYNLPVGFPVVFSLVWADWGANLDSPGSGQDYDLMLVHYDTAGSAWETLHDTYPDLTSATDQTGGNTAPIEYISTEIPVEGCWGIVISQFADSSAGRRLDLYSLTIDFDAPYQTPESSIVSPCCGENVQCVGATLADDTAAPYSSRGPTIPSETTGESMEKPEFTAPTEVTTTTYAPDAFSGTSAAAPHAAGALALVIQANGGNNLSALETMQQATLDLGVVGRDNLFGFGRVQLDSCLDGCFIDGECIPLGTVNPDNSCQICSMLIHPTAWSDVGDGTECDDGLFCTSGDSCQEGMCTGGTQTDCSDAATDCTNTNCDEDSDSCVEVAKADGLACTTDDNECTVDACEAGECTHTAKADGLACASDNNSCTIDSCDAGVCTHVPGFEGSICADDGNECTDDVCMTGVCSHPPKSNQTPCAEDGIVCTEDFCTDGLCTHGVSNGCFINGLCVTTGAIRPTNSCEYCNPEFPNSWSVRDNGSLCSDEGDGCTDDVCSAGQCVHLPKLNDCATRVCGMSPNGCFDCGTCQTGFGCNTQGQCNDLCEGVQCPDCQGCVNGGCQALEAGTLCSSDMNECTLDICSEGSCTHPAVENGLGCSDGDACTTADSCQEGACMPGDPVQCTQLDQCHVVGVCNSTTGECSNPAVLNGTECSDGEACTVSDICLEGACVSGEPVVCQPLDQCHLAGSCDATDGTCSNPTAPDDTACNDEDLCTQTDSCQAGVCTGENPVVCEALDQCHLAGTCESSTGICSNPKAEEGTECDDANLCTQTDTCQAGVCTGENPVACEALDQCHLAGICESSTGICSNPKAEEGTECDDADLCTQTDTCVNGLCSGSNPVTCPEPVDCHLSGTCDPTSGECNDPTKPDGSSCESDGHDCTDDQCSEGECVHLVADSCLIDGTCYLAGDPNPSNPCQQCDVTVPDVWTDLANDTACEDGNFCTVGDACLDALCTAGEPNPCDEVVDACNEASCDEEADQCVPVPVTEGTPCGDTLSCSEGTLTLADSCDGQGECADAGELACAPYSKCLDNTTCATTCADEQDCAQGMECLNGECRTNEPPVADAGVDQTVDEGATVTLDGRDSTDADEDAIVFAWVQTAGPDVVLDDANSNTPTFLAPSITEAVELTFQLIVNDGFLDSDPAETTVTVQNSINEVPVADAGDDITVDELEAVELNGAGSSDPNGDPLTYQWSQDSGPAAALTMVDNATLTFTAPDVNEDSTLVFKLIVNDGSTNSEPATITVTVLDLDEVPIDSDSDIMTDDATSGTDAGESSKPASSGCSTSSTPSPAISLLIFLLALTFLVIRRGKTAL